MIVDFLKLDPGTSFTRDVAVVGSGPAGMSIARRLAAAGYGVVLIESGGVSINPETQDLYKGENVGMPHEPFEGVRMRMLGGSSNCWGGGCIPLEDYDFEGRPWIAHSGWPIKKTDLAAYYADASIVCGAGPFRFDVSLWDVLRQRPAAFDSRRIRYCYWQMSAPLRFGEAYRDELAQSQGLTVLLNANVVRVGLGNGGGEVDGLDVKGLDGRTGNVRARQYVLACGGIENARLLLNSNDVAPAGVGNQNDVVGRYFMEHPYSAAGLAISRPDDFLPTRPRQAAGVTYRVGFALAPEVLEREQVYAAALVLNMDESRHDLFKTGGGPWREAPEGYVRYGLVSQSEQSPKPESRITLSAERDSLGNHLPRIDWRVDAADKRSIEVLMRTVGNEYARLGLGRIKIADWLLDPPAMWGLVANVHHIGTTRMGEDVRTSVVDGNCKVHGIANLHIAGSSVFTTSSYVNPTLTIVALALRLAERLDRLLKG